jgi:hypothetical protein
VSSELRAAKKEMTLPANSTVIVTAQITIQRFAHKPTSSLLPIQVIPACDIDPNIMEHIFL